MRQIAPFYDQKPKIRGGGHSLPVDDWISPPPPHSAPQCKRLQHLACGPISFIFYNLTNVFFTQLLECNNSHYEMM